MAFREDVIAQLERHHSQLDQAHQFDFYIYAPTEAGEQCAAAKLA
jgi:Regulator of ribonuclease activity B